MASIKLKTIRLLASHEIDPKKWNACVAVNNGLVYSLHEYLSIMSDSWHGVIVGDYQCIFPIPWKQKLGIRYAPIVPFVQQLSLLGDCTLDEQKQVISVVQRFVRYGDYNISNEIIFQKNIVRKRTNFYLPLSDSYDFIRSSYTNNLKRNIKKANALALVLEPCLPAFVLNAYASIYMDKAPVVRSVYYARFRNLVALLEPKQYVKSYVVRQGDNILGCALFWLYDNRLYNILPCTFPEEKKSSPMHFLLDQVIRKHAQSNMIFDFEGSDLKGVRQFYEQFSPIRSEYFQYHWNHLPFPLNLLKK